LAAGKTLNHCQQQHGAMLAGKRVERARYLRRIGKRNSCRPQRPGLDSRRFERNQNRGCAHLPALCVKRVEQNPKKPRPNIRPGLKLLETAPRPVERFLHQILGRRRFRCQPPSHSEQAPGVWNGGSFKFVLPRGHFCSDPVGHLGIAVAEDCLPHRYHGSLLARYLALSASQARTSSLCPCGLTLMNSFTILPLGSMMNVLRAATVPSCGACGMVIV